MSWTLTETALTRLLQCLDADPDLAGQKYEDLRRTLTRYFEWNGARYSSEDLTDETLLRAARKLDEGVEILNLGGYCYRIAQLVFKESLKKPDQRWVALDDMEREPVAPVDDDDAPEDDQRRRCLNVCLAELTPQNRELIIEFYRDDKRDKINRRKALAERLGIPRNALGNRAQRLRDKLQECIEKCLRKKTAT
ncbi:MAG: sigma-70 family RNA polymerase sigma factor [Acidobacteria bacterium]|nr:sigma-70 family RNA polymerase sigma factor [Acidobacteriota bacterium]